MSTTVDYSTKIIIGWSLLAIVGAIAVAFAVYFVLLVVSQRRAESASLPALSLGDEEEEIEDIIDISGPAPAFSLSDADSGDALLEEARAAAAEMSVDEDDDAGRSIFSLRRN